MNCHIYGVNCHISVRCLTGRQGRSPHFIYAGLTHELEGDFPAAARAFAAACRLLVRLLERRAGVAPRRSAAAAQPAAGTSLL